jgi:uncharacterized protein (UPF0261 family)
LKENLNSPRVRYKELPVHINEPGFAEAAVRELENLLAKGSPETAQSLEKTKAP